MRPLGWKVKWRGPAFSFTLTAGGVAGESWPVVGSRSN